MVQAAWIEVIEKMYRLRLDVSAGFPVYFELCTSGDHMNHEQYQEAKRVLAEITVELKRIDLTPEQRQQLETHAAALATGLLRPWLPLGRWRRAAMLTFLLLGLLWPLGGSPIWCLAWLVMLTFSPRIVGEIGFALGRFSAATKDS